MPQRLPPLSLLCLAALAAMTDAMALNLGQAPQSVPLGRTLNMAIPVRLEPGEWLNNDCVRAEVSVGDTPVSPGQVRVVLEPRASQGPGSAYLVHVRTLSVVEEPFVSVTLTAGCSTRMSRRYTAFADPVENSPGVMAAASAPMAAPALAQITARRAPQAMPTPASAAGDQLDWLDEGSAKTATAPKPAAVTGATTARTKKSSSSRAEATRTAAAPASRQKRALAERAQAEPQRVAQAPAAPQPQPVPSTEPAQTPARPNSRPRISPELIAASAELSPRLRLDTFEYRAATPQLLADRERSLVKAEASAAAVAATTEAMSTLQQDRQKLLERDLKKARAEAESQRELARSMRSRLGEAESRAGHVPVLGGALALVLAAAGWMGWRLRRLEREKKEGWLGAQALDPIHPQAPDYGQSKPTLREGADQVYEEAHEPNAGAQADAAATPLPDATPPASPVHALDAASRETQGLLVQPVTIDGLLDLAQQTEFFLVLGQDESAIEALESHLMQTGGTAAVAHLKLLETYERQGNEAAYERAQQRMRAQFGPAASQIPPPGNGLQDYPDIVQRLCEAWDMPIMAMAELEGLMFGTDGGRLLGLEAYQEALMLYSLLRELQEHGGDEPVGTGLATARPAAPSPAPMPAAPALAPAAVAATVPPAAAAKAATPQAVASAALASASASSAAFAPSPEPAAPRIEPLTLEFEPSPEFARPTAAATLGEGARGLSLLSGDEVEAARAALPPVPQETELELAQAKIQEQALELPPLDPTMRLSAEDEAGRPPLLELELNDPKAVASGRLAPSTSTA